MSIHETSLTEVDNFSAFYGKNASQLQRSLALVIGDPDLAADAVNEAMIKAHQRWTKVQHYANPAGWCFRVALNWSKRRSRRRNREILGLAFRDESSVEPADALWQTPIGQALGALSVDHRTVLVLRHLQGLSTAEVASMLDIAEGTVKSRLARATRALHGEFHAEEKRTL